MPPLVLARSWRRTTIKTFTDIGAVKFCWLLPQEKKGPMPLRVEEKLTWEHGAFAYFYEVCLMPPQRLIESCFAETWNIKRFVIWSLVHRILSTTASSACCLTRARSRTLLSTTTTVSARRAPSGKYRGSVGAYLSFLLAVVPALQCLTPRQFQRAMLCRVRDNRIVQSRLRALDHEGAPLSPRA